MSHRAPHEARRVDRAEPKAVAVPRSASQIRADVATLVALQHGAGNAAVARHVARERSGRALLQREPTTIVQHGEMSGDQFQIAAALLADSELHVYLLGATVPSPRDKARQIYDFYVTLTGIAPARVHLELIAADPSARTKSILHDQQDPKWGNQTFSVGAATNILKRAFRKEKSTTKTVRDAWMASSGVTDDELDQIIKARNIRVDAPIAVLWSRQSGAVGGLHPDLDSSYTGIGQLAERFDQEGYTVMIVGDDPDLKIAGPSPRPAFAKAVRLGEFWSRDLRGKPRTAQFKFFEHLRQLAPTLTHVGMRSGNLEAYAYMGHRVLFIEERDRSDAPRMQKLVGIDTALKYRTVRVEDLPTRTGRALMGAPAPPLLDDATFGKQETSGARFEGRQVVDHLVRELRDLQRTFEKGAETKANKKQREARQTLIASLDAEERRLLDEWIALATSGTPAHQKALKDYGFLKKVFPELPDAIGPKGFSDTDADRIVAAAKGVFWCVSVPEEHLGAFIAGFGKLEPGEAWLGKDGETYLLGEIREERERVTGEGAPRVQKTTIYDFVRQPTPAAS